MALFGKPQKVVIFCPDLTGAGFPLDGLILDVSIAEQHTIESTLTQYPVEDGATIADHIQRRPRALDLTVFLTDTPSDLLEAATEAARNIQTSIQQSLNGLPDSLRAALGVVEGPLASTRSKDVYALLQMPAKSAGLCRVVTDLEVYQNMLLVSLSVPRSTDDGRGLTVVLRFQQLTVATTSTEAAITIEEPPPSVSPTKAKTKSLGDTAPKAKATAPSSQIFTRTLQ